MITKLTLNFSKYLISFISLYLIYYGSFEGIVDYSMILFFSFISWLLSVFISGKLGKKSYNDFFSAAKPIFIGLIFFVAILTSLLYFFYDKSFSKIVVYGSLLLSLLLELSYAGIWKVKREEKTESFEINISLTNFLIEFLLITWILLFYIYLSISYNDLSKDHILPTFAVYLSLFIGVAFTHQFKSIDFSKTIWRIYGNYFKSYGLTAALLISTMLILFDDVSGIKYFIIGTVIYTFWSSAVLVIRYIYKKPLRTDEVRLKFNRATTYSEVDEIEKKLSEKKKYRIEEYSDDKNVLSDKLKNVYLQRFPQIFEFINRSVDLTAVNYVKSVVLRSADVYNVETLPDNYINLFMNLHELNDMRRLNAYYININNKLIDGGLFIGTFQPIRFRYKRFREIYPKFIAQLFYFLDFLWRRVSPKLPFLQKIYFAFTKGKNRALPLAEGLGRLYYCGFQVIDFTAYNNFIYFIAKKVDKPSTDPNPSYGPLFKMNRICKNGEVKGIYKLRTMHPYSEYLQKFIFEHKDLQEGGKINEDFRITKWGKVMRKLWLDEFPMFINYFKGDLKLVGVRPLSRHFYSLYPEDLKERRIKYKPGLVPPFYADLPKTLDEVIESERKYLDAYEKSPLKTDITYFVKAWYNILIKRARSG
jgi:lipopolysaccharide/colanic/teichoic acid biosynthesis glycosyltransferase